MASKIQKIKDAQGYQAKPTHPRCAECAHFRMDVVEKSYKGWNGLQVWNEEKNLRCALGSFKVAKMGVCDKFVRAAMSASKEGA